MESKAELSNKLTAKEEEITRLVAAVLDYGDLSSLDVVRRHRLNEEVEALVEEFEEALTQEGDPLKWSAHEARLAKADLGSLMLERHEIGERLLDVLDDANPDMKPPGPKRSTRND